MRSSRSETVPPELDDALALARERLGPLGSRVLYFTTIGSTNDVAASLAADPGAEGVVVIADAQTAGRGRRGRTWFSPPASGLYVSTVLAPGRATTDPERATALLTIAAGVALAEGIGRVTGLAPSIKWPNDLLVGRRKLAGILAEGVAVDARRRPVLDTRERHGASASASGGGARLRSPEAESLRSRPRDSEAASASGGGAPRDVINVVLGYGINVGPMAYPPELHDRATSLEAELGRPIDRADLCVETLVALASRYRDLLAGRFDAILDAWRRLAPAHRGARVSWETMSGPQAGITEGIDERGALLVRVGDRVERIVAGELRWDANAEV